MSDAITDKNIWSPYVPVADRKKTDETKGGVETTKRSNDELDKNAFLLLLITQMKYQDPLNPVEDKEFVAQMAQFSALEQMNNLNTTSTQAQAFSLVGKYINALKYSDATGEYTEIKGKVDAVHMINKKPYLVVTTNGVSEDIPIEDVIDVLNDEMADLINKSNATNTFMAQNIALIGKHVQAITFDKDGNPTGFVEGKVNEVKVVDGRPLLIVGDKEVYSNEILSVGDSMNLLTKDIYYMVGSTLTKGKITDVAVTKDKAQLVIDGETKVDIDKIDAVSNALKYVGKEVKTSSGNGVVEYVSIIGGKANFRINGQDIPASSMIR